MKKLILICLFACCKLFAQTNPSAQTIPWSQNFGTTTFSSMPTGTAAWTATSAPIGTQANAESSTASGNATVTTLTSPLTTEGCYGYANSSNGRFYIQTGSGGTNGTSQLACAINTTNWTSVKISYDVEMITAGPRTIGVVLQYRVGTSGSWTTISGGVYSHNDSDRSSGNIDSYTNLSLPSGGDNNSVVQLRWATWRGSQSGKSSGIAIDNISITATSSQITGYFRSKQNGNWNDINTWEASPDNSTWSNANVAPKYTANTVTVLSGDTVSVTATDTIDQVVVDGNLIYANVSGSTLRINNGTGSDLIINGTFEDIGPNALVWASSATWNFGSSGKLLRTRNTSADNWRDYYNGGISTIPATANWIIRKTGSDNPELSSTGGMYYPNLTIENTSGSTWTTSSASTFTGSSSSPIVKGNLDIGGSGTNNISFLNDNTNASPVLVNGNLTIKSGSTLRNHGTGFEVQGNLVLNGSMDHSSGNAKIVLSGSNNQTISTTGTITFKNLTLNKASTSATVTLSNPADITDVLTFTTGYLITTSTNLLTFNNGSSVSGANNNSFISGPVKKIGNAAFAFPTGKSNNYQPVSISAPSNSAAAYTAEYFHANPSLGSTKDVTIDSVSNCEYWTLNNVGTVYPVSVSLGWNGQSCFVSSLPNMRLTKWNGSQWKDFGNISAVSGTVKSANVVNSYGTFTLAQTSFICENATLFSIDTLPYTAAENQLINSKWYKFSTPFGKVKLDITSLPNLSGSKANKMIIWGGTCDSLTQIISDTVSGISDTTLSITTTSLSPTITYYLEILKSNSVDTIQYYVSKRYKLTDPSCAFDNDFCPTVPTPNPCELVCNGDFEINPEEPNYYGQMWNACGWTWGSSLGTSDYFSSSTVYWPISTSGNLWGYETPHSGDHYAGFYAHADGDAITPDGHEYVLSGLRYPLQAGVTYQVSFWVSRGDHTAYATNGIGAYLATSDPYFTGGGLAPYSPTIACDPTFTTQENGWTEISGTFVATGGESYIMIGDFLPWSPSTLGTATLVPPLVPASPAGTHVAYYYLDDVSVVPVNYTITATPLVICQGETVTLESHINAGAGCVLTSDDPEVTWSSTTATVSPTTGETSTGSGLALGNNTFVATIEYHDGCEETHDVDVYVNPLPTITVNSPTICAGETAQLTAGGGVSYSWTSGATSTGTNTADASPTTTTSYTVTGTDVNGCTNTAVATVTVNPLPDVPVISGDPACYDLENVYTITNYNSGYSYNIGLLPLLPSPGTLGSLNITLGTFPVNWNSSGGGTIYIQVTDDNGCMNEGQLETDADDCECDGTHITTTNWSNAFSLTANTLYALNTNAIVTGNNVVLTNATINIAPGVSIYIGAGKKLTLDHCHLFACTDMWQGLFVDDGGELIINNGTLIEDAFIAADVPTSTGTPSAILTVDGAIFNKNRTGIRIMDYQQTVTPYPFTISDAVFTSREIAYTTSTSTWATTSALKTLMNSGDLDEHYAVGDLTAATLVAPYSGAKAFEGINLTNTGVFSGSYYDVEIGGDNSNETMNVFDNLLFGVNASNSNFTCYNNAFQYILKVSSPSTSGIAVNAVSTDWFDTDNRIRVIDDATAGHGINYFYDCSWGVNTDRYHDITISNCDMRSTAAPIPHTTMPAQGEVGIYIKTPNATQITADANTLTNIQNGIIFFGDDANSAVISSVTYSDAQEIGDVNITNNTIQATFGSTTPTTEYAYIGIMAVNLMNYFGSTAYWPPAPPIATHAVHYVNVNDNHLHNVHNGISLYNWFNIVYTEDYGVGHYPVSDRNFVSLRQIVYPTSGPYIQVGLQHNLNWNSEIVENNIIGFDNSDDLWNGINVIDNIPFVHQTVMCNRVENTGIGIQFVGSPNSQTTFFNNTMEGSGKGFVLDNSAIGTQGDNSGPESSKNLWPASSYSSGQLKTYTRNAGSGTDPLSSILYIDGTADPDQDPETGGASTFNDNEFSISTYIYSSPSNGLIQITGTDINSISCTVPTSIAPHTGGGNRSMESSASQIEILERMVTDSIDYNYFASEQRINDRFKVYRTLILNPSLKDTSLILQNFFVTAQNGNIGKLAEAEAALAAGILLDAENQLNAISPNNDIEANYLGYSLSYLHYKNNTYTPSDSALIKTIANGCPVKDGMVVYQARSLYSLIYNNFMMYADNCVDSNPERSANASNKIKQEDFSLEVFPNPNSGNFTLFINGKGTIDEPVEVSISDFTGKLIKSTVMQLKNNSATFDTGLGNGMYMISVKDSKGLIGKPKKTTIIR